MIKIGSLTFQHDAADMVAQCYTSLPLPDGKVKILDTYIYAEEDGESEKYRAFSIFEYNDSDEEIIQEYLEKRFAAFTGIPGVTYKIEDWIRIDDALRMLADGEFALPASHLTHPY